MGIFKKIKGRKYYKELFEHKTDECFRLMEQKAKLFGDSYELAKELSELRDSYEELLKKYHQLLLAQIKLAEAHMKITTEKGTTNDNT